MMKNGLKNEDSGWVESVFSGIVRIRGLGNVFLHETLLDEEENPVAVVIGFDENFVEALILKEIADIKKPLFRSRRIFSIPISGGYVGRIVDGLGNPIDGLGGISGGATPVFKLSPAIIEREPVSTPLSTGIKIIDVALPLGRGQRELIVGDRKLGKSALATGIALNQKNSDAPVICVYVVCGQKKQKLDELITVFSENNAFLYTAVVAATSGDSLAAQYLAPFVGCAIGEYFRDNGKDALVIFDDLSSHAKIYRDISLLLNRPPGREAYPGDIFSLHAGLLERAAKLSKDKGGGSLTALPIIETQEDDITSFIPTNLISITDGQIYLERGLFQKGFLPAVNIGFSVSRVGGQAQPKILREVVSGIRLSLAQHKELQKLSQLETVISEEARKKIYRGDLILEILKQDKKINVPCEEQVFLFYAVGQGFFDDIQKEKWKDFELFILELARNRYGKTLADIKKGIFNDEMKKNIFEMVEDFKQEFLTG